MLQAIAHELGGLTELVGGAQHCAVLLVPLEKLAQVEEVVVRDRAVESITAVVAAAAPEAVEAKVVPLVRRLAGAAWFTGKASACALMPVVYPRAGGAEQEALVSAFTTLAKDPAPMVRRAAVAALGPLARAAGKTVRESQTLYFYLEMHSHIFVGDGETAAAVFVGLLPGRPGLGASVGARGGSGGRLIV